MVIDEAQDLAPLELAALGRAVKVEGSVTIAGDAAQQVDPGKPSIAVLPFKVLSTDTRYDILADAITHDLIADLARIPWLKVISRGSSFRLRGSDEEVEDVGDELAIPDEGIQRGDDAQPIVDSRLGLQA